MKTKNSILIIEEDLSLKQTLVQVFRSVDYRVVSTGINIKALKLLDEDSYDLVVLDLNKSQDYGLSLFFKIKRDHPQLPVILLSSSLDCGPIPCIEEEQAWMRITKPFEPHFILKTTEEMVSAPMAA